MWANWNYRPRSTRVSSRTDVRVRGENVASGGAGGVVGSSRVAHLPPEERYSNRLKYRSCPFPFEASMKVWLEI